MWKPAGIWSPWAPRRRMPTPWSGEKGRCKQRARNKNASGNSPSAGQPSHDVRIATDIQGSTATLVGVTANYQGIVAVPG